MWTVLFWTVGILYALGFVLTLSMNEGPVRFWLALWRAAMWPLWMAGRV